MVPYDVAGGSDIIYQIGATNSDDNALLICISEGSIEEEWIKQEVVKERVLEPLSKKISQLGIVKFEETVRIPSFFIAYRRKYAQYYKEFSMSPYAESGEVERELDHIAAWVNPELIAELFDENGGSKPVPYPSVSNYYPVSGVFAVDSPDVLLLTDLRKQIARGEVDQKYLYWDVQGAKRWADIADRSTYQTAQMAQSLLGTRGGDIISRIIQDAGKSAKSGFRFINLGVGIGWKDLVILRHLLEQTETNVGYVAVDQSFAMMQLTIQRLEPLMRVYATERLHLHYIVDDFIGNTERFNDYINKKVKPKDSCKIIGFLGGSLGNFSEANILTNIQKLMSAQDYLLLGVEYVGGRSDEELKKIYSDEVMRDFWSGPVRDITGASIQDFDFDFPVLEGRARSDVDNSRSIVSKVLHRRKKTQVQVCWMTKYEPEDLEKFLQEQGFIIVEKYAEDNHTPPWFGKYILKC
jgi:uncharacterized SAM-dependent methyltransferase